MSKVLTSARAALRAVAAPDRAKGTAVFFKTGPGEYAEGDVFIGVTVPAMRAVARAHRDLTLADLDALIASRIHEERALGLAVLVAQFEKGDAAARRERFDFYLAHLAAVNNWDLVDATAAQIVGAHLLEAGAKEQRLLARLARSKTLWERRIAMVATYAFIRSGDAKVAFSIAVLLLDDEHDLMHKAVGWMLREVGKHVSEGALREFLETHVGAMPRTALRYSIERFSPAERKRWLAKPRAPRAAIR